MALSRGAHAKSTASQQQIQQKTPHLSELPPVSWTTKIKSKKQEAFHV